jgi:hypothetical protein
MNCARFWTLLNKKSTYEKYRKCLKSLVPKDRILIAFGGRTSCLHWDFQSQKFNMINHIF